MTRHSRFMILISLIGTCSIALPGCSWLINLAAPGTDATKSFQIPKATKSIAKCVTSSSYPVSCPVPVADVVSAPLSTHFEKDWIAPSTADASPEVAKRAAAAQAAINILNDDKVQTKITALFNLAVYDDPVPTKDRRDDKSPTTIAFDIDDLDKYMSDLETATANGSWNALADAVARDSAKDAPDRKVPPASARQVTFISNYLKAYFRDGHFISVTVDATAEQTKLQNKVNSDFPGLNATDAQAATTYLFKEAGFEDGKKTIGNIGSTAFVTRGGQNFQFPALQGSYTLGQSRVNWSSVNYVSAGTDILRVILSAVFDAHMGVPGVPNATGANMGSGFDLPKYDQKQFQVTPTNFEDIETRANEVESVSGAAIGRVVRGIGFVSLNNEAIATLIETLTAMSLRKETEKVLWCWYQCGPGPVNTKADYQARDWAPNDMKNITVTLTGLRRRATLSGNATQK